VADAGEDQDVEEEADVELDGSGSSGEGLSYTWSQTGGPSVTLEEADTVSPFFDAPELDDEEEIRLTFDLTVTDDAGDTDTDTVEIRVEEQDPFCFIRAAEKG
jgi:hypothetical protein